MHGSCSGSDRGAGAALRTAQPGRSGPRGRGRGSGDRGAGPAAGDSAADETAGHRSGPAVGAAVGLAVLCAVLAGLLRHRWAWYAGIALQVVLFACGLLHIALAVLGVLFGAAWGYVL